MIIPQLIHLILRQAQPPIPRPQVPLPILPLQPNHIDRDQHGGLNQESQTDVVPLAIVRCLTALEDQGSDYSPGTTESDLGCAGEGGFVVSGYVVY